MELEKFMNNFLPDYMAKFEKVMSEAPDSWSINERWLWACRNLFPEALQNFADRICEAQKKICEKELEFCAHGYEQEAISRAEHIKIEEL
jgi:hypothetical protein